MAYRHRTLKELAADVIERIAPTIGYIEAKPVCATNFKQVVDAIRAQMTFPAVLVIATGADYEGRAARRHRDDRVNIIVVGEWSADVAGSDDTVWETADTVARRFIPADDGTDATPTDVHSSQAVEIHGVIYHPLSIKPLAVGDDRTAMTLLLQALNPMQDQ